MAHNLIRQTEKIISIYRESINFLNLISACIFSSLTSNSLSGISFDYYFNRVSSFYSESSNSNRNPHEA